MKIIKFSLIPGLSLAKIRRRSRIKHRQHHTNLHEPHKSSLSVLHRDQLRLNNNFVQIAAFPLVAGITSRSHAQLSPHIIRALHIAYTYDTLLLTTSHSVRVPTPMNTFLKLSQSPFRVAAFNYAKRSISTTKMVQIKVSTSSYCIILAL